MDRRATTTKRGADLRPGDGIVFLGEIRQVQHVEFLRHERVPKGGAVVHFFHGEPMVTGPDTPYDVWG